MKMSLKYLKGSDFQIVVNNQGEMIGVRLFKYGRQSYPIVSRKMMSDEAIEHAQMILNMENFARNNEERDPLTAHLLREAVNG